MNLSTLTKLDSNFPKGLREIHDPPEQLFYQGSLDVLKLPALAIVGTRQASSHGKILAYEWAKELARQGLVIVSGLAYGIDTEAHRGALEGGGKTIAVLAQDLAHIRPHRNLPLAQNIVKMGGLLLSEQRPGESFYKSHYLKRNRIISGLSEGVLVVEAAHRSGALNTANHALDQDREVMAVPGRVGDLSSQGCLRLIQKGAALVSSPKDVLDVLGWKVKPSLKLQPQDLFLAKLYQELCKKAAYSDQLQIILQGSSLNKVQQGLSELELEGWVTRSFDGKYHARSP